jgi:NAD(P)-dependent dehydrogenase (short-subunit alcohol dehydrogenase family)
MAITRPVVVLGATSPLGQRVVVSAALRGAIVVLWDRDLSAVDALAEGLRSVGGSVRVATAELDRAALADLLEDASGLADGRATVDTPGEIGVHPAAEHALRHLSGGAWYARFACRSMPGLRPDERSSLAELSAERGIGFVCADFDQVSTTGDAARSVPHLVDLLLGGYTQRIDMWCS